MLLLGCPGAFFGVPFEISVGAYIDHYIILLIKSLRRFFLQVFLRLSLLMVAGIFAVILVRVLEFLRFTPRVFLEDSSGNCPGLYLSVLLGISVIATPGIIAGIFPGVTLGISPEITYGTLS